MAEKRHTKAHTSQFVNWLVGLLFLGIVVARPIGVAALMNKSLASNKQSRFHTPLTCLGHPPIALADDSVATNRSSKGEISESVLYDLAHEKEVELATRACSASGMNGCQEILAIIRQGATESRSTNQKNEGKIFKVLLSGLDRLKKAGHRSKQHPALAYLVDKLIDSWLDLRRMSWNATPAGAYLSDVFRRDPTIKVLRGYGIRISLIKCNMFDVFYYRDLLYHLALEHTDTFWGQAAFVELSSAGWNIGDPVDNSLNPSVAKAVILHGEKFLRQYPKSLLYNNILFDLADANQTIWNFSSGGEDSAGRLGKGAYSMEDGNRARVKAIRYFREFLHRGGQVTGLLPAQIRSIGICESCNILPRAVDVKQRLSWLEQKKRSDMIVRYFHLVCE